MSRWSNVLVGACAATLTAGCASAPTVYRALDRATAQVVAERAAERRRCYLMSDTARAGKPSRTDVSWELSMLGNPVHVEATSNPRDEQLEACYTRVIENMRFPGGFPHSMVSMSIVEEPETRAPDDPRLYDLPAPPLARSAPSRPR